MSELLFSPLDWKIAWRHLRAGDERPAWVWPLIIGAIYLIVVGVAMAFHAASLDAPATGATVLGPFGPIEAPDEPTPLQRYYGAVGGVTLIAGLMALVLGLLARFFNLLPTIITMSVLLGCMALVVVLSLMSGLESDLREKILDQKAHIRVSRENGRPFDDYIALADALEQGEGIVGASPYLEGEIMVRSGLNRQGAILAGIMSERQTRVSNLPELVKAGDYAYLTDPAAIPEPDPFSLEDPGTPYRLRHLEKERKKVVDREPDDPDPPDVDLGTASKNLPPPPEDEGDDESGGWEDPEEELGKAKKSKLPKKDMPLKPAASPAELELSGSMLRGLPSVTDRLLEEAAEDDDWEDPEEEIAKLREEGKLPPAPEGEPKDAEEEEQEDGEDDEDDGFGEEERVLAPILIGKELSMELGVRVGSEVQLITPIGRTTPAGQIPGVLAAQVGGVFFSGMYEYDRKNVYAPLPVVQRFLLTGDRVTGIEVALAEVESIDEGKAEVERIVAAAGRGDELIVEDWRDLNRNLFSAMFLEKVAMFIALLFVVLVASFGILASNLMSVMEKSKEIAILKAMGMSDAGIMRSFVAEGLVVGLLGSFGGIAMGLALVMAPDPFSLSSIVAALSELFSSPGVYYIEGLPVLVNIEEVALVGVAALVIVCLSSIYPALIASRLRPVDALRHTEA